MGRPDYYPDPAEAVQLILKLSERVTDRLLIGRVKAIELHLQDYPAEEIAEGLNLKP